MNFDPGLKTRLPSKRDLKSRFEGAFSVLQVQNWKRDSVQTRLGSTFLWKTCFLLRILAEIQLLQNYKWYPNHSKFILDHLFAKFTNVCTCKTLKTCILPLFSESKAPLTQIKGLSCLIKVRLFLLKWSSLLPYVHPITQK